MFVLHICNKACFDRVYLSLPSIPPPSSVKCIPNVGKFVPAAAFHFLSHVHRILAVCNMHSLPFCICACFPLVLDKRWAEKHRLRLFGFSFVGFSLIATDGLHIICKMTSCLVAALSFLLLVSFLSNFIVQAEKIDAFSANDHQSVLVELFTSRHKQKEVKNRETEENGNRGGEGKQRKISRERVARHHQQQQKKKRGKCERLNEVQKYAKLERAGGRNQIFMAASPREAGRNFPALMPKRPNNWESVGDEEPQEMTFMDIPLMDSDGTFSASSLHNVEECDEQCREIERKLNDVVEAKWQTTKTGVDGATRGVFRMDDDAEEEATGLEEELNGGMGVNWGVGAEGLRFRRGGCYLERFVPIGNCTKHGFEESMGDEKLCTACQGIFVLNRECFPLFVNSVVCDRHEFDCIFDRLSGIAQGKCRPKVLGFKVMRNRDTTAECEQWVFEYIEVPVACECYLSKRSMWLEAVPPSTGDEHL